MWELQPFGGMQGHQVNHVGIAIFIILIQHIQQRDACYCFGKIEFIRELLDHGVDVNSRVRRDQSALHFAVQAGSKESVRLLLSRGANVNAVTDTELLAPLHLAIRSSNYELCKVLIDAGAKVNADKDLPRAAMQSVFYNYIDDIGRFNVSDPDQALQKRRVILKLLLDSGAMPSSHVRGNQNALQAYPNLPAPLRELLEQPEPLK